MIIMQLSFVRWYDFDSDLVLIADTLPDHESKAGRAHPHGDRETLINVPPAASTCTYEYFSITTSIALM